MVKNPPANAGDIRDLGQENLLEEDMATHSVFLPRESHGQKILVGHSPQSHKELDKPGQLHTHTHEICKSLVVSVPSYHRDRGHTRLYKIHQSSQL